MRAGIVSDPAEYRWRGYGEVMAGRRRANEALRRIYGLAVRSMAVSATEALRGYRMRVFAQGEVGVEGMDGEGKPLRRGIEREEVVRMLQQKGRISANEYVHCRVR